MSHAPCRCGRRAADELGKPCAYRHFGAHATIDGYARRRGCYDVREHFATLALTYDRNHLGLTCIQWNQYGSRIEWAVFCKRRIENRSMVGWEGSKFMKYLD